MSNHHNAILVGSLLGAVPIASAVKLVPLQPKHQHHRPILNPPPRSSMSSSSNNNLPPTKTAIPLHVLGMKPPALFAAASNKKLRSGKWIPEEEDYALLLIALFEQGLIENCENGSTLRSYLSQKLHCAPMRISKKFAGKGIGKMVYCKMIMVPAARPELIQRIQEREQKFHQAVYPSNASLPAQFRTATVMTGLVVPPPARKLPSVPMPPPTTSTGAVSQAHTTQLHESYIRALKQTSQQMAATVTTPAVARLPAIQYAPTKTQQSPKAATNDGVSQQGSTSSSSMGQSTSVQTSSDTARAETPDFLSGFDTVLQTTNPALAVSTTATAAALAASDLQYSPPFTSRSFDDFHCFSLLDDLPENSNTKVCCTTDTTATGTAHDTTALFTAESYAMFAQESATETSQHAAYLLQGVGFELPTSAGYHQKDVSLYFNGMLKLVSDHTYGPAVVTAATMIPEEPNKVVAVEQPPETDTKPQANVVAPKHTMSNRLIAASEPPKKKCSDSSLLLLPSITTTELTPVERFVGANVSEPSATSSAFGSGSSSDSSNADAASMDNNSSHDDYCSEGESIHSDGSTIDIGQPQQKKAKIEGGNNRGKYCS